MSKLSLQDSGVGKMSVATASEMARVMIQREAKGPGDLDNAMRRIEARYGVPYSFLWSLRYRPPKELVVSAWHSLRCAYRSECERQARLLQHEIAVMEAMDDDVDPHLVEQAEALVRKVLKEKAAKR